MKVGGAIHGCKDVFELLHLVKMCVIFSRKPAQV